ncbi:hypothetical protein Tco_0896288, partial [Tanacetum coccineum]
MPCPCDRRGIWDRRENIFITVVMKCIKKEQMKNVMKFKEGSLPTKYLGVPLVTKRLGVKDYEILSDKIKESMSSYWAFVFKLPKTVVKEVNGILKRFLWSNGDSAKDALKEFSEVSGLLPNLNKSTLFFGSLNSIKKEQMKNVMQFKEGSLPTKYLGVPLVTKRLGVKDYEILSDKQRNNDFEVMKNMAPRLRKGVPDKVMWVNDDDKLGGIEYFLRISLVANWTNVPLGRFAHCKWLDEDEGVCSLANDAFVSGISNLSVR